MNKLVLKNIFKNVVVNVFKILKICKMTFFTNFLYKSLKLYFFLKVKNILRIIDNRTCNDPFIMNAPIR
jgi:hypothetical protein